MYNIKSVSYSFKYMATNDSYCEFDFKYNNINAADANCKLIQHFIHMVANDSPKNISYSYIEKAKNKIRSNIYIDESLHDLYDIFKFHNGAFNMNFNIEAYNPDAEGCY